MEIYKIHFIALLVWWIRECQEGQLISYDTALLIVKCTPKYDFLFLVKRRKNREKLLVIVVLVFEKEKCTYLIDEILQPKGHSDLF